MRFSPDVPDVRQESRRRPEPPIPILLDRRKRFGKVVSVCPRVISYKTYSPEGDRRRAISLDLLLLSLPSPR